MMTDAVAATAVDSCPSKIGFALLKNASKY